MLNTARESTLGGGYHEERERAKEIRDKAWRRMRAHDMEGNKEKNHVRIIRGT